MSGFEMTPDDVNGAFILVGGVLQWNNCRVLHRDRQVAGVSPWYAVFILLWGFWSLIYYPSLGQWSSFAGNLVIVSANITWLGMVLWFARERAWRRV